MRKLLIVLILGCSIDVAFAQLISVDTTQSQMAQIDLVNEICNIQNGNNSSSFRSGAIKHIYYKPDDIIVNYALNQPLEKQYYTVSLLAKLNNQVLEIDPNNLLGDTEKIDQLKTDYTIIWANPLEAYIDLEGELELALKIELRGKRYLPFKIDCDSLITKYTQIEEFPHYLAAGVGVASIISGQIFKTRSGNIFDQDYRSSENILLAEPNYQKANQNHHAYLLLTWAGGTILVADLAFYWWRKKRAKQKEKVYKDNCINFDLNPSISYSPSDNNPFIGAKASINF